MNRRAICAWLAGVGLIMAERRALAWDSEMRIEARSFPQPLLGPTPETPHPKTTNGNLRYFMRVVRDAIGGVDTVRLTSETGRLYTCSQEFLQSRSLTECAPAVASDIEDNQGGAEWGWVSVRRAWDNDAVSEHYLITKAAAELSGLTAKTSLFEPFWIRYPSVDGYVASARRGSDLNNVTALIAGQRWEPADPNVNTSWVTRGISLLELSQLPDFSNSVADWAAGNELCPLAELPDNAFDNRSRVNACHAFDLTMGAINATHFFPLNREMFKYYHGLATKRMQSCYGLMPLLDFYNVTSTSDVQESSADTEVHECENEAFAYEMVALHFLEDAWATGHMWKRWGYPRVTDFPATFKISDQEDDEEYPPEEEFPRQMTMSLVTGVVAGSQHGAKAAILKLLGASAGFLSANAVVRAFIDDPLNAPTYDWPLFSSTHYTSWTPDTGASTLHGGGDLFWSPASGLAVATSPELATQKLQMLECVAASMLEIYSGSPKVHDKTSAPLIPGPGLEHLRPTDDVCWDHWVNNASMQAGFGPLNIGYVPDVVLALPGALAVTLALKGLYGIANVVIPVKLATGPAWPSLGSEAAFLGRVAVRLGKDQKAIANYYREAATQNPTGTEAARWAPLVDVPHPTVLGVGPMADTVGEPDAPPGVDYVDQLLAPDVPVDDDETGRLSGAVRRMFWRGNLEHTCLMGLENNGAGLYALQSRCIDSAAGGGDPDACTACVAFAEPHIPRGFANTGMLPSKCQVLQVDNSQPTQLPGLWFDSVERSNGLHPSYWNVLPYQTAKAWCTDVEGSELTAPSMWTARTLQDEVTAVVDCGSTSSEYHHSRQQVSISTTESLSGWSATPHLLPTVRTFWEDTDQSPSPEPCGGALLFKRTTSSLDAVRAQTTSPAPLWDNEAYEVREFSAGVTDSDWDALAFPSCGVTQRVSTWNTACANVHAVPVSPGTDLVPGSGETRRDLSNGNGCMVREPRAFAPECPGSLRCSSSGECVIGSRAQPDVLSLDVGTSP